MSHYANGMYFVPCCCGRPVGGGNLRDSDAQQRQQRSQTDHCQADGSLRLPKRPDCWDHQGEASLCRREVDWYETQADALKTSYEDWVRGSSRQIQSQARIVIHASA
ncbi:hypothetical protein Q8A73_014311 [Channa argus]|nr:hypothetical protein Q8A73_014311 [Channa argus]